MNVYTEEQAAEKWCPETKRFTENGKLGICCVGSKCMGWRWQSLRDDDAAFLAAINKESMGKPFLGYCGLAGEPD